MKEFEDSWEQIYRSGHQLSKWPFSDLVALVERFSPEVSGGEKKRVLELGPGVGANVPFFLGKNWSYWGVEGSATAVRLLVERFPELITTVTCADFTVEIPAAGNFDLVVDRSSLTLNTEKAIRSCLGLLEHVVPPGGMFYGIDWFSEEDPHSTLGIRIDDRTRKSLPPGRFEKSGEVHFSSPESIARNFRDFGFEIVFLETGRRQIVLPEKGPLSATINFVASKR